MESQLRETWRIKVIPKRQNIVDVEDGGSKYSDKISEYDFKKMKSYER
jgi:hypothetical protein